MDKKQNEKIILKDKDKKVSPNNTITNKQKDMTIHIFINDGKTKYKAVINKQTEKSVCVLIVQCL